MGISCPACSNKMDTTLLQPFQFMGAVYAGFVTGLIYSILGLFIPYKNSPKKRFITITVDVLFYVIATAIAALIHIILADGRIQLFMLLTMVISACLCVKTTGKLIAYIRQLCMFK